MHKQMGSTRAAPRHYILMFKRFKKKPKNIMEWMMSKAVQSTKQWPPEQRQLKLKTALLFLSQNCPQWSPLWCWKRDTSVGKNVKHTIHLEPRHKA